MVALKRPSGISVSWLLLSRLYRNDLILLYEFTEYEDNHNTHKMRDYIGKLPVLSKLRC